jgi:outer membrane protein insertion porin family
VYGKDDSINSEYLRFSTGVGVTWVSPFGPLKLVLAKPLNDKSGDDTQLLQFQFGQQF